MLWSLTMTLLPLVRRHYSSIGFLPAYLLQLSDSCQGPIYQRPGSERFCDVELCWRLQGYPADLYQ